MAYNLSFHKKTQKNESLEVKKLQQRKQKELELTVQRQELIKKQDKTIAEQLKILELLEQIHKVKLTQEEQKYLQQIQESEKKVDLVYLATVQAVLVYGLDKLQRNNIDYTDILPKKIVAIVDQFKTYQQLEENIKNLQTKTNLTIGQELNLTTLKAELAKINSSKFQLNLAKNLAQLDTMEIINFITFVGFDLDDYNKLVVQTNNEAKVENFGYSLLNLERSQLDGQITKIGLTSQDKLFKLSGGQNIGKVFEAIINRSINANDVFRGLILEQLKDNFNPFYLHLLNNLPNTDSRIKIKIPENPSGIYAKKTRSGEIILVYPHQKNARNDLNDQNNRQNSIQPVSGKLTPSPEKSDTGTKKPRNGKNQPNPNGNSLPPDYGSEGYLNQSSLELNQLQETLDEEKNKRQALEELKNSTLGNYGPNPESTENVDIDPKKPDLYEEIEPDEGDSDEENNQIIELKEENKNEENADELEENPENNKLEEKEENLQDEEMQKQVDELMAKGFENINLNELSIEILEKLGEKYYSSEDWEKCIKICRILIDKNPNDATYYNMLGNIYHDKQQYHYSLKNYKKAIELDPKEPSYYGNLGTTYYRMQAYDKAIIKFEKAIELDPKEPYYYNILGNAYHNNQQYDKVIENYEKVIALDPDNAICYQNLTGSYYQKQEYDKANINIKKAIELDPSLKKELNSKILKINKILQKQQKKNKGFGSQE